MATYKNKTIQQAERASNKTSETLVNGSRFNMFSDLKTPVDLTGYTLFRGTTDFTQLRQFELYESGYPYLVMVSIPEFLKTMAANNNEVAALVKSYKAVVEGEFLGFDSGLTNIESDPQEISNGIQSLNLITKVNAPSATQISMTYREKAGSVITKMHELYLRSVRDPGTTFKTYNGLIVPGGLKDYDPTQAGGGTKIGFANECFSFLYMHTDNTGLVLERAVYFTCCQPTTAQLDIYNGKKGEVQFQEISVEYQAFPLMGTKINAQAKKILNAMNDSAKRIYVERNSWDYNYEAIRKGTGDLSDSTIDVLTAGNVPDLAVNYASRDRDFGDE